MKNTQAKTRPIDKPYEIWVDGDWEWRVLKKWQVDDDKPFAKWFCGVKSPYTYGDYALGDVYVSGIKEAAIKIFDEREAEGA